MIIRELKNKECVCIINIIKSRIFFLEKYVL